MTKFHLLSTIEDVEPGGMEPSCMHGISDPRSRFREFDLDGDAEDDVLVERWASPGLTRPQYHSVRAVDLNLGRPSSSQSQCERLRKPTSVSIGLLLVAGTVFNLVVHLHHMGSGTRVAREVAATRDMVVASVSRDGAFDCAAGYANWKDRWSLLRRAWCCEHESKACPEAAKAGGLGPAKHTLTTMEYSYLSVVQDGQHTCDGSETSWGLWGRQERVKSLEVCQQLCSEAGQCKYVQWQARRKVCHLYQTCDRKRRCDLFECGLTFAKSDGMQGNSSNDGSAECGSCSGRSCTACSCSCGSVKDQLPLPQVPEESFACSMTCDLNCYQGTGAEDVPFTKNVDAREVNISACRSACEATADCEGIVWAKDASHCSGRKNIHLAQCQPGDKYVTEMCRQKPVGKCAILGDPHIRQFDNIYGNFVNDYDAGDFALVRSSIINVHARFGFTKQFPKAASLIGLAFGGAALEEHSLVVVHTGPGTWQDGFAVYWDGGQILEGYPSEFDSYKLRGRFAAMDPSDYHGEARDTIGDSVESSGRSLPSYHFEFADVDLSVYCLLGPDSMNAIVEMRKLSVEMDGLCGNFDCKPENDVKASLRERGLLDPLADTESLFSTASIKAALVQVSTGRSTAILAECQTEHPELYEQAQTKCAISEDQAGKQVCIVDVCEAGNVNIGSLDTATEMVENEIEADINAGKDPSARVLATRDASLDTSPRQTADVSVPVPATCHCTCKICSCSTCEATGRKGLCSSYVCPAGYVQRRAAERIECASEICTSEDLEVCCNERDTCDSLTCLPGQVHVDGAEHTLCAGQRCDQAADASRCCVSTRGQASCASMKCPEGYVLNNYAEAIPCRHKRCSLEIDAEVCCNATAAQEPFDCSMTCDLNCSDQNGTNPDLGPMSEYDCREACEQSPSCQGMVWNRRTQRCQAKEEIELSKCRPGKGDFVTSACRRLPLGKCALVGDPHIRQFDNHFGKYVSVYDAGDYAMINSSDFKLHARFGFTEEFPDATSTTGVAMWGPLIKGNSLAVIYLGPIGWERGFKVYWNKKPILSQFPSSYTSSDGFLRGQWDKLDPEDYHKDARHTIGDTEDTEGKHLPSFYFEFEDLDLNLYCLLGPDSMNCVIEMRKLKGGMDGLCGNFNCDADDDSKTSLKKRGFWEPLSPSDSVFRRAGLRDAAVQSSNTNSEEVLGQCKKEADFYKEAEKNCGQGATDAEDIRVCMVDACLARNVNVARADVAVQAASH